MLVKKTIPVLELIVWSRRSLVVFFFLSVIPVTLYTVFGMKFLHLPWTPIAVLGTAVAFVIGFKNNACYDRMWESRKIWGGIVNSSRSWGIMVRDFVNNKHAKNDHLTNEELEKEKRKLIDRHIAWMTAHRYNLRTPKPWEDALADKANMEFMKRHGHVIPENEMPLKEALSPYLDDEELTYVMGKTNKATTLISLQSKHLESLGSRGHIWEFSYLEMKNMLVEFYTLQGKNERIKNFPYPRQFATLNLAFVWIFIVLIPFGVMGVFDDLAKEIFADSHGAESAFEHFIYHNFVWLAVPFCMTIAWVFWSIERIGETSENPFQGTPTDVPISTMSRGIEIDLLEMMDATDIPKPLAAINEIEM